MFFVLVFALVLSVSTIYINCTSDVLGRFDRDVYLYLIEALKYSGFHFTEFDYVNELSPLVSFLTSLVFDLGFISENVIFAVTGVFFFFSILGLYYLFKLRFNSVYTVFGVCLYCASSTIIMWASMGTIDIPALCLSIWSFYFFIKAFNDGRYFILAIPLMVLSTCAKYVSVINFAPLFFYFLSKGDFFSRLKSSFKNILLGIIFSFVCVLPFIYFYITNNVFNRFLEYAGGIHSTSSSEGAAAYLVNGVNDFLFYIINLPSLIFRYSDVVGLIFLFFLIVGLVYVVYKVYGMLKFSSRFNVSIFLVSVFGIVFSFLLTLNYSIFVSLIVLYVFLLIFTISFRKIVINYNESSDNEYKCFSYDLLMFTWFLGQFIFLSAFFVKAIRYGIAFFPPLVFFITYGFSKFLGFIPDFSFKKYIPYVFIVFLIILAFGHLTIDKSDPWVEDEKIVSEFIESNDTFSNLTLWADRPSYAWYTQSDIHYMGDRSEYGDNFSEALVANNVDYYISHEPRLHLKDYSIDRVMGTVVFFKRNDA